MSMRGPAAILFGAACGFVLSGWALAAGTVAVGPQVPSPAIAPVSGAIMLVTPPLSSNGPGGIFTTPPLSSNGPRGSRAAPQLPLTGRKP